MANENRLVAKGDINTLSERIKEAVDTITPRVLRITPLNGGDASSISINIEVSTFGALISELSAVATVEEITPYRTARLDITDESSWKDFFFNSIYPPQIQIAGVHITPSLLKEDSPEWRVFGDGYNPFVGGSQVFDIGYYDGSYWLTVRQE